MPTFLCTARQQQALTILCTLSLARHVYMLMVLVWFINLNLLILWLLNDDISTADVMVSEYINRLKPSGHFTYHQV
jgi:hypothetical protein